MTAGITDARPGPAAYVDTVARLTRQGRTTREIAHSLRCSTSTIAQARALAGAPPAAPAPAPALPPIPDGWRNRGVRGTVDIWAVDWLTERGHTAAQIATALGCSERSVVRARARAARLLAQTAAVLDAARRSRDARPIHSSPRATGAPVFAQSALPASPPAAPRECKSGPTMQAVYRALLDGQWHQRDALVEVAAAMVDDHDALWAWIAAHGAQPNTRHRGEERYEAEQARRIHLGARLKAKSLIASAAQAGRNIERGGPTGTDPHQLRITPAGRAALTGDYNTASAADRD